jgi:hypothetical protein
MVGMGRQRMRRGPTAAARGPAVSRSSLGVSIDAQLGMLSLSDAQKAGRMLLLLFCAQVCCVPDSI